MDQPAMPFPGRPMLRLRWILLTLAAGLIGSPALPADDAARFPLRVDEGRRHLVDRQGVPFLYHADTAWMLFLKLSEAEAVEYLERRKAQGFNTVQVQLTGFRGATNRAGDLPFAGSADAQDLARPNEPYFAHVDRVMAAAHRLGLFLSVAPLWSGCCGEGWAGTNPQQRPNPLEVHGDDVAERFGEWLGRRYGHWNHVMWILGGDNDPHESRTEIRALGRGLKKTAPSQLITYHAASSHSSTDVWPADESWLDVVMVYTYFRGFDKAWNKQQPDVHEVSHAEYVKVPLRPFFLGESTYEGEHGNWGSAAQARRQAWWCVLGGGFGHAYGSPNWNMPAQWREVIDLPGARSLVHLRTFLESRPWWRLVPDLRQEVVVADARARDPNQRSATALAADGSWSVTYLPSPRSITVDLTRLAGASVDAAWLNPRTGESTPIGEVRDEPRRVFEPPGEGDWVLVLDSRR